MKQARGFSLIELMVSLVLGLLITGGIVQVMASNKVTERLNRAIASAQESGRFVMQRLRADLVLTGRYDPLSPNLNRLVDVVEEGAFLQNRPVPLPGDFAGFAEVGAIEGIGAASDTLVVAAQGDRDCRGFKLGYAEPEEFYVVNRYFLEGNSLRCVGYDGRVLRGQKAAAGHDGHTAVTLLDDVQDFQVLYGIANHEDAGDNFARPVRYISADGLAAERARESQVVAIRIAVLLRGDADVSVDPIPTFQLLNEAPQTPTDAGYYREFETTITLRNAKNFMRSKRI